MMKALSIFLFLLLSWLPESFGQGIMSGENFGAGSVLSQGSWYRIGLKDEGVYRIDYSQLRDIGYNGSGEPRIYGNNFGQLSYYNADPRPDDLVEIPVRVERGGDGIFNEGDYLLFYAPSADRWSFQGKYEYKKHAYSDSVFYFLKFLPGTSPGLSSDNQPPSPPTRFSSKCDFRFYHEVESENLIKSGREWYQPVSASTPIIIRPSFGTLIPADSLSYTIRVAARGQVATTFRLSEGGVTRNSLLVPEVNIYSTTGTYARTITSEGKFIPSGPDPVIEVSYHSNGDPQAKGWLDNIILTGRSFISYKGTMLRISDSQLPVDGSVVEYSGETGGASGLLLWNITDPANPSAVTYTTAGSTIRWKGTTDKIKSYILFSASSLPRPVIFKQQLANQDLHASGPADMVIVSHPLFLDHARKIADIHLNNSGLVSLIVTPQMIYNEFSGGIADISAIRNFLRMMWIRHSTTDHPLKYLLILGDGSIDNRTLPPKNPNFVPTYQTQNSTVIVSSFMSDDFYGLLDEAEGEAEGYLDLGIGRMPVYDTAQAGIMVRKIERYINDPEEGTWKNIISLIADDEDFNIHMNDAEGLASLIESTNPWINLEKIYFDAYRQISSASGHSYPDATSDISDRINSGALIVNYLGHGNELGLAHERVVKTETINSWRNKNRLPLFITATCEFSRFDDVELNSVTGVRIPKSSAGEMVLLNPDGGGIALLTTTRIVYSAPNYTLNKNLYNYAFTIDSTGDALRLGDIMRLAKINSGGGSNKRNFSLLGDPALRITFPWNGFVKTDSINGKHILQPFDTIRALSTVTLSGHIEDNNGNIDNSFSGLVYITIYDKVAQVKTLANDGGSQFTFNTRSNILFRGKTQAVNGKFRTSFLVPKDINYNFGKGKISYYASGNSGAMRGSFDDAVVGGFSDPGISDMTGPDIKLFLYDTLFREGGISDSNPRLLAIISDEGGINTTGNGIGHDITAWIDGDQSNSIVLNNWFEADLDSYKSGKVLFNLSGLEPGVHTVTLKAWDNFNNSATGNLTFEVKNERRFLISDIVNYPNPVTAGTYITASHNRPEQTLNVSVSLYDSSGRLIRILKESAFSSGLRVPPLFWDGNDSGGARVKSGIYYYNITIENAEHEVATGFGRLIIL